MPPSCPARGVAPSACRRRSRLTAFAAAVASLSLFGAATAQAKVNFDRSDRIPIPQGTGGGPVAVGDLNGDGRNDMVVGSSLGIDVKKNLSPGNYSTEAYAVAGTPENIIVRDFDADGAPDVVVLTTSGNVQIFRGTPTSPASLFPGPTTPLGLVGDTSAPYVRMAAGDIDGQNGPDLVVSDYSADGFMAMLNDGTGNFTVNYFISGVTNGEPRGIGLARIDGDPLLDVVMVNSGNGTHTLSTFLNTGGPPFYGAHTETATNVLGEYDLAVGNFAGSAASPTNDVVVTSFNGGYSLLQGAGDGSFSPGATISNAGTNIGIAAADFDRDGNTDFGTWDRSGGTPRNMYFKSFDRTADAWVNVFTSVRVPDPINGSTLFHSPPIAADMDGDGTPDLVAADNADNSIAILYADTTAPSSTIDSGPSGATTTAAPAFTYNVATPESTTVTFECRLTGPGQAGTWSSCGQAPGPQISRTRSFTGLADGDYAFSVRAADVVPNVQATPTTRTFSVDTTPPDTAIAAGPLGTVTTGSVEFELATAVAESGATYQCRVDGPGGATGTWETCTSPLRLTGLANGAYVLNVRASDALGNQDQSPVTRAFTVAAASAEPAPGAPAPAAPGTPSPAAPNTPSIAPTLDVPASQSSVRADNSFLVPVTAAAGAKGRAVITTVRRVVTKNKRGKTIKKARLVLTTRSFTVAKSGKVRLKVKLSKVSKQKLKGLKRFRVTVKVTVNGKVKNKTLMIHVPAAKKKAAKK